MANFFIEGGSLMFLVVLLGVVLAATALLSLLRPGQYGTLTTMLAALTAGAGVLGTALSLGSVLRYIAHAEEDQQTLLKICWQGTAESLNNLILAMVFVLPALAVHALAVLRARRRGAAGGA